MHLLRMPIASYTQVSNSLQTTAFLDHSLVMLCYLHLYPFNFF